MTPGPDVLPFLPYGRQWIDDADVAAVAEAVQADYLTTGPRVAAFEEAIAGRVGAAHCAVLNSATSGLHAAYAAAGVGPGDTVVTSPLTFCATANAALYLGANVRFVDVEPETGNLDPTKLEAALDETVKVVAPVDFAGHPADYPAIREVLRGRGIILVADAAHSYGGALGGVPVGRLADMTVISMHPVKPFTTGEGGAVLTDDPELHRSVSEFRSHGIVRDECRLSRRDEGPWYHEMQALGFNYRMTDLQCALGLSQLGKLDGFIARRGEIAARYGEALSGVSGLELPVEREEARSGWHLYPVRVQDDGLRRVFFERLREVGLGVQVHYLPVYLHPYYQGLGFEEGLCPVAEDWYRREVSLPMYPALGDDELESAIGRVRQVAREVLG